MAKIAVGGMQHETNTFAPTKASYAMFEQGGGWPTPQYDESLFEAVSGANLPVEGAIQRLRANGHTVVPLAWAAASPSAQVTDDAFERVVGGITSAMDRLGPFDGVYLDLHGAMVTESYDDGEGEILRRVRSMIGDRVPLVASLDLHANITAQMVKHADALTIYRTYPHVDMADTGARAILLLENMLKTGNRPAKGFYQFNFLTGLPSQCNLIEPCLSIYKRIAQLSEQTGVSIDFATGFPMADIHDCGMSLVAFGPSQMQTDACMSNIQRMIEHAEKDFAMELLQPDDAVQRALARGAPGAPIVLADTQDNPGAGGNGDTTGLLAALMRQRAPDAVLGLLCDGPSAKRAHDAGQGATIDFTLGEISGVPGRTALGGRFLVERLGDGQFTCTGPMFKGFKMKLGPMALLKGTGDYSGVRVVLASRKCQAGDQEMFRHLGIEPKKHAVIALKSSVHFRADFQPIAKDVLVVQAPGPALANPADFAWTKLRKGIRLTPLGKAWGG
jgi:microcystin degradation protein MlrC